MSSVYWAEFRHEIKSGMRGPTFPIVGIGLALYVLLVLSNAGHMENMGATGVPRNASYLVFQLTSGMSLWLFFIWAWVFGQSVLRDQNVHLHENVLCSPVSIQKLLVARYLGACVVALALGAIMPLSMFLTPALAWLNLISPDLVGPQPFGSTLWSVLVFILPTTFGMGALFVVTALRSRSIAGPFGVAAILMLVWMAGMIVIRGGDINDFAATVIDPTAFAEAERQTTEWTPAEKISGIMSLTPALIVNRLLWCLLPVVALMFTIRGFVRDSLVLGPSPKQAKGNHNRQRTKVDLSAAVPELGKPNWLKATLDEALWQWRASFHNWGTILALGILIACGVGGSVFNVVLHGQGPLLPRAELLLPFMTQFFYLFELFFVAGFVGMLARRDMRAGFDEMIDASISPMRTRVLGRALAAVCLTLAFTLAPVLSAWMVMGIAAPSVSWLDPVIYQLLILTPAMLEVCAVTLLVHSLIRSTGTAHAVTMMLGFIAIVNHEVALISYPPGQLAIPAHVSLSALGGWQPWLDSVLTLDLMKLAFGALVVSLAWLAWPRGKDLAIGQRLSAAVPRLREGAVVMASVSLLVLVWSVVELDKHLVENGEYLSLSEEKAEDAAWEQRWWQQLGSFTLEGGDARIQVDSELRSATATWSLYGVKAPQRWFGGSLPHGLELLSVEVEGQPTAPMVAFDQFAIDLGQCAQSGCDVTLTLKAAFDDWPSGESRPWLHPSGVWLRAKDVLPTLGLDPERPLKVAADRDRFELPTLPGEKQPQALAAAQGVAPAGQWRWQIHYGTDGASLGETGEMQGPLNFASVWLPTAPEQTSGIWHSSNHRQSATEVAEDLEVMDQCVASLLGETSGIDHVVQAPRELGELVAYGSVLWLPEHLGWDAGSEGFSRYQRRAAIAEALARQSLDRRSVMRAQSGAQWLLAGVPGWVGLECVKRSDGVTAWLALQKWHSDQLTSAMGSLDAPVVAVAEAGKAKWLNAYSALAITNLAATLGAEPLMERVELLVEQVNQGATVDGALAEAVGPRLAGLLLGMPIASDITLIRRSEQLAFSGQRWQWQGGGWSPIAAPEQLTLVDDDQVLPGSTVLPNRPMELTDDRGFMVLDSWPGIERTPEDNHWP